MHCRKVVLVAWESVVRRGEINGKGTLAAAKDKEFARLCAEVKIESAELGLAQIVSYGYDDDDGALMVMMMRGRRILAMVLYMASLSVD